MVIPEMMLFQIRVEVFSRSEHLLPSHKVPRCIQKKCLQSPSEKCWPGLPPMQRVEEKAEEREDFAFCHMSHNRGSRITLKMLCRERTAANFCVDACLGP